MASTFNLNSIYLSMILYYAFNDFQIHSSLVLEIGPIIALQLVPMKQQMNAVAANHFTFKWK